MPTSETTIDEVLILTSNVLKGVGEILEQGLDSLTLKDLADLIDAIRSAEETIDEMRKIKAVYILKEM